MKKRASRDTGWSIEDCALGAAPGQLEFNVMADTQFSSFLTPRHDKTEIFQSMNEVRERLSVEVKTLETIIPDIIGRYDVKNLYLKLDTQGYDLEVLKGAGTNLDKILALQSEASVTSVYHNMPHYNEVIQYIEKRGFLLSGIYPNNSGHFPALIEFDCYMISRKYCEPVNSYAAT